MTDYDALVNELRNCRNMAVYSPYWWDITTRAADAIEELQQIAEHYKGCSDDWYKEACDYKAMIPRWISVEERLPENSEWVLAYRKLTDFVWPAFYNSAGEWMERGRAVQHITHWMSLPAPPKEE